MNEWISCKDKLPPEYHYVLVYARLPGTGEPCPMTIARWVDSHKDAHWELLDDKNETAVADDEAWYLNVNDITHWMELPERPK